MSMAHRFQIDRQVDRQKTLSMCRSPIAWEKHHTHLGTQFMIKSLELPIQYESKNIQTGHNILQSNDNLK